MNLDQIKLSPEDPDLEINSSSDGYTITLKDPKYRNCKLIALDFSDPDVKEHMSLSYALEDLRSCLDFLNLSDEASNNKIKHSLISSAVSLYIRCFKITGNNIRTSLRIDDILKNYPVYQDDLLKCHLFWEDIRNKYIAHDVSGYFQITPFYIRDNLSSSIDMRGVTQRQIFTEANTLKLRKLTELAVNWAQNNFNISYQKLLKNPKMDHTTKIVLKVPGIQDSGKARKHK